jgi:hypothetical protein
MPDREELRATAAQCVALAQSTTAPRVRVALTIMAQKLYDMARHNRRAGYETAQREFNDSQMLPKPSSEQRQPAMQQQQQIQPKDDDKKD